MIEKEFIKISEQNDCEYTHDSFKVPGELGSFVHISKHYLKIYYNQCLIKLSYDLGNSNTAEFKIDLIPDKPIPEFNLRTITHFTKLILLKKRNWNLRCENSGLNNEIIKLLEQNGIIDLLENSTFEPIISGLMDESKYRIHTLFSLKFQGKSESMNSIVEFHKGLIDLLKMKYCS